MLSGNLKKIRKEKKMTLEELATRLGTSKQTIHRYENGIISNIPHEKIELLARALEVSPSELMGWSGAEVASGNVTARRLPILGEIACGMPIYANETHEGYATCDDGLGADFCLLARGDSMTGARIFDGDIVFIRSQDSVDNGEIAAVIIDDEATLKRVYYYPNEEKLILSPENPKYAPLVYMGDELLGIKILGKAVAFQSTVI